MLGILLAGGKSRRFERDKLLFRVDGKPLIQYAFERLESASLIDKIVVVASPENARALEELGYRVVVDRMLLGPISGVYTALGLGDAFIVAGDMPLIVPEFVDYIIARFERSGGRVCVPRWENGYLEPLHAVYPAEFRSVLEQRIGNGDYALNRAIRSTDACYIGLESVPEEWLLGLFNVNRKEDLKKLSRTLF
ncbi:molybdenum cofactor guanylyltransferase MobA [Thermococcus thioreducens]|uniref:Probable molybdenum cofactor guanylyltransferase n=1 Tax=Thermococcus thioreducens TaxID=277988 RepID=A0A0Q2MSV7_9EURY|nr:molybdenum cofactor guanylyltransferase MobA [Thermococcus thioreducens]ASJ11951.1 molybdenum cofactor guanylyltransferase MobA [Thermococcus thioreducens]KQH82823.1 molybdopterin-guanine dinucleotide biosynthesis protein MobA [Thermococcus thioreducens]SEW11097.1 molybdenum cofactor guanylyltransferase [Thermococcus thioreducens]